MIDAIWFLIKLVLAAGCVTLILLALAMVMAYFSRSDR